MSILHRLADGSVEIQESFDIKPFGSEEDRARFVMAMTEAAGKGKSTKLEAKISAMPVGVTRNKTYYPASELLDSVPSWTNPYPCPVIKDHNEYEIDNIVGRIKKAYVARDGATESLWFDVQIIEATAQENVASGLWNQVSIGTRVESCKCSICGTDLATEAWCGHERGEYYRKNEDDEMSAKELCYWVMGKITGREVSFVTTPSAASAGVRSHSLVDSSESESHYDGMILAELCEEDTESLRMVEAFRKGSPSSDGEAIVPSSEKEESMPPKVDETEEAPVVETELSDVTTEGEETVETTESDEAVVDGPANEEEVVVDGTEGEAEAQAEVDPEESTEEGEPDPEPSESDGDVETADEAEVPNEEAAPEEPSERDELLARVATLEGQVLLLKAQVYVESGLRDGILAGERDALVELHSQMTESSLDELIDVVKSRRDRIGTSEELLTHKVASPALKISDDDNADNGRSGDTTVNVRTADGRHSVVVAEDRTKVTIKPKFNQ